MIDDSVLLHGGTYDPAKARAYYLRTRKLKGRKPGSNAELGARRAGAQGASNSILRDSRREELKRQQAALNQRLDRLRAVLEELVDAAQKRSGVKDKPEPKAAASKDAAKGKKGKAGSEKPLTEKQKADKRKASKEQYEKENGTGLATEVRQLHAQVKDIRAKIERAQKNARKQPSKPNSKTASNRR